MKSQYEYKVPAGKKVLVTPKEWKELFGTTRGISLLNVTEAYVQEDGSAIFHHVITNLGKVIITLTLPVTYTIAVLQSGIKEVNDDLKGVYFQKSKGRFLSDNINPNDKQFDKWKEFLSKKLK